MYVPDHFREPDIAALHALIREHSFGTLVSVLEGTPFATHMPFLLDSDRGPWGTLAGHVARANPHWRAFVESSGGIKESLVLFTGPHAYISPSWYEAPIAVPTWNYV